jgi:hypothetical protein
VSADAELGLGEMSVVGLPRAQARRRGTVSTSRDHDELLSLVSVMIPRLVRARVAILSITLVTVPLLALKAVLFASTPKMGSLTGLWMLGASQGIEL